MVLKAGVDFENAAERQQVLHVTATANGLTSEPQAITINVTDANDAPTAIDFGTDGLVTTTVSQTATNGSAIATLRTSDPDPVDFHIYSIVTGDGSNQVLINAFSIGIDFQVGKLIVRDAAALATLTGNQQFWIKSTDLGGLSTWQEVTVTIDTVNHTPTGVNVVVGTNAPTTTIAVAQNGISGRDIGRLSTVEHRQWADLSIRDRQGRRLGRCKLSV